MEQSKFALVTGWIILAVKSITVLVSASFEVLHRQKTPLDQLQRAQRIKLDNLRRKLTCITTSLVLVLGLAMYSRNPNSLGRLDDHCMTADADIVGDGVRAATWAQFGMLAAIATGGMFSNEHSAIQEVGAGLLVTHIALAIALLVPSTHRHISPIDSILGTMILDAQNSALSIQLVAKQILASRWQTCTVMLGQLAGLVVIGVLIDNFTKNGLATEECNCISAFWWGWIDNCGAGPHNYYLAIWTYYLIRVITTLHSCLTAGLSTISFDQAKRREEEFPCAECGQCLAARTPEPVSSDSVVQSPECCDRIHVICTACRGCRKCNQMYCSTCELCEACTNWRKYKRCPTCPGNKSFQEGKGWFRGRKYSQIPASTSVEYIEACAYSFISLLAAEGLMATYAIQPSSPTNSVGQITSVVIAVATAVRAIWVFGFTSLILQEPSKEFDAPGTRSMKRYARAVD